MASDAYSPNFYSGDNAFSYAAAFSPDNTRFAFVIPVVQNESQAAEYHLGYVDMTTLEKQMIASIGAQNYLFYGMDIYPADGSIFMAIYTGTFAETVLCKLDGEIKANDVEHRFASSAGMDFTNDFFETSDCRFLSKNGRIYLFSDQMMFVYNRADNELLNFYTLPGSIVNAYWVDPEIGLLEVITDDGLITDYYMSFSDNKILSGVEVLQSDQSIVTKSCSARNGAVVDQGSIYTISDSIPGKLLYVDFVTDPNVETLNSYAEPDAETFAYTVTVGEDKDLEFVDVLTGKTSVIDNPYHLSGDPTPVLAHAADLCAAVYEDGTACVMNIKDRSVERLKKEYAAGEIMSFCFSDDDAYLLVITSSGRLDIYETGAFALVFSERVKRFALDTHTLSGHDLKAQSSKDGETLFVTGALNFLG